MKNGPLFYKYICIHVYCKKNVSVAVPSGYRVASLTLLLSILGKYFEMNNNIYCMHFIREDYWRPLRAASNTHKQVRAFEFHPFIILVSL